MILINEHITPLVLEYHINYFMMEKVNNNLMIKIKKYFNEMKNNEEGKYYCFIGKTLSRAINKNFEQWKKIIDHLSNKKYILKKHSVISGLPDDKGYILDWN